MINPAATAQSNDQPDFLGNSPITRFLMIAVFFNRLELSVRFYV
jgi:hypothetical protein